MNQIKRGLQSVLLKVRTWKARIQSKTNTNMNQQNEQPRLFEKTRNLSWGGKIMVGILFAIILMAIAQATFGAGVNTTTLADPLGLVPVTGLTAQQEEQIKLRKDEVAELETEMANWEIQIAQIQQNIDMAGARIQELEIEQVAIKAGKEITGTGTFQ